MSVIRWEDPPPHGGGNKGVPRPIIAHELIARQLRREPGRWAVIHEQRTICRLATTINQGIPRAYAPAGTFEAVTRLFGDLHVVYARYVGKPS